MTHSHTQTNCNENIISLQHRGGVIIEPFSEGFFSKRGKLINEKHDLKYCKSHCHASCNISLTNFVSRFACKCPRA